MNSITQEQWRPIEGYEGYEVSNLGKVRRLDGIDSRGRNWKGKILRPEIRKDGYLKVVLCKEGKVKCFQVHRLVAMTFIPNPEGLPVINHRDENPKNNRVDNLEWCTQKYNCNYGTRNERQVQTKIRKGIADPEMCGLSEKERKRMWYQKRREQILEQKREQYRLKKKQKKNKDNRPSDESLW